MPPCSLPASTIEYGGQCRTPVTNCLNHEASPELSSHLNGHAPSASESAFSRRYDVVPAHPHTAKSLGGGGGKRNRRTPTRRRRRRRRKTRESSTLHVRTHNRHLLTATSRTNSKRGRTKRGRSTRGRSKRSGGVGYRFDLSTCPPGGMPDTVQHQTTGCDFY
jgi:hypothetical protein